MPRPLHLLLLRSFQTLHPPSALLPNPRIPQAARLSPKTFGDVSGKVSA
ncbi:hypothetical protein SNOG_01180 [Parastagonospora nodorum SN15]|uniref:Uncharacterized protein n=1 Tax=Phaeosphaeria nodorum (strain SN15 / ATCC MYA-4574 / FGSC 10173) TaxID=321614 RepID=Q0V484_PHANO|nr:hypothetical protein SNOG_01180 [Parastagonospora nodorum SN15]EAT90829.1 hypothetical protein SNOG_01180 [Parastagonospora nodorum SN15]